MRRAISCVVMGVLSVLGPGVAEAREDPDAAQEPNASDLDEPRDVDGLSARMRELVDDDGPTSAKQIRELVARGLPPGALAVTLEAARRHPRVDLYGVLVELSAYRRAGVRGRALAARAALGGHYAYEAISAAADDLDPGVRRLAYALAQLHPGPNTEAVISAMLDRDPELAASLRGESDALVPGGPA